MEDNGSIQRKKVFLEKNIEQRNSNASSCVWHPDWRCLIVHRFMSGTFEGKVLQLHHLAILQWAGAWNSPQSGQSALHSLCLGAASRTWMGGGMSVAPLRGPAWGAKARYLVQSFPNTKWNAAFPHSQIDAQGCTALNYLLSPLKPSSDCTGTANFEIVQSLLSWTANMWTSEMQVEAGQDMSLDAAVSKCKQVQAGASRERSGVQSSQVLT